MACFRLFPQHLHLQHLHLQHPCAGPAKDLPWLPSLSVIRVPREPLNNSVSQSVRPEPVEGSHERIEGLPVSPFRYAEGASDLFRGSLGPEPRGGGPANANPLPPVAVMTTARCPIAHSPLPYPQRPSSGTRLAASLWPPPLRANATKCYKMLQMEKGAANQGPGPDSEEGWRKMAQNGALFLIPHS